MKFSLAVTAVVSALSSGVLAGTAGCGKAPSTIRAGQNQVTVNGKQRTYTVTLPQNYDNTKEYKLIFGIHWLGGNMNDVVQGTSIQPYYGLPALANNTAIFVAPEGLRPNGQSGWANSGGEDIAFMREIIKATDANFCINEKLRFSTGFSYGGGMSYSIACTLGDQFRAVAVLSGAQLSGCQGGSTPVAYYGQHGTFDSVLNIQMGRQLRDNFVRVNGCQNTNAPEPARNSRGRIQTKYTGCQADKPVWWTAFDGDHTPIQSNQGGGTDKFNTFTGPSVWEFFSQFQ
ncbi:carbohydrate esterase family 1 protein [Sporormia fimetaria CBS 119925]|uniref:feruloyl esterase n=1 Tax=Sporormia fimetaria CBS 119925 TaxID=1340428 RepID=A0A6A6VP93_9PLEO|nr:carbohydrate esterase family 1 protein [Sporormia fimetaria CBS 119925]